MGIFVKCLCMNVTVHLAGKPAAVNETSPPPINKTTIKSIGQAELGVGGVAKEFDQLTTVRQLDGWKCFTCFNCRSDIYLQKEGAASSLFVSLNLRLLQDGDDITKVSAPPNFHFSPTFRIFMENNDEVANSLLEAPDVYDTTSVELLQTIQKRIESTVATEAQQMQERIREFEHQQQEAFREFQVVAYRDRKILWHNICSLRRQQPRNPADSKPQQQPQTAAPPAAVLQPTPVSVSPQQAAVPALSTAAAPPTMPLAQPAAPSASAPSAPSPTSPSTTAAPASGTWVPALSRPRPTETIASTVKAEIDQLHQSTSALDGPHIPTRTSFIVQSPRPVSPRPTAQVGASVLITSMSSNDTGVFRLEEDAVVEEPLPSASVLNDTALEISPAAVVQVPVLIRPAAPTPAASISHAIAMPTQQPQSSIFGTSVPINIPARIAVTSFEASEVGGDLADVPLSSTQRIKGYL